MNEFFCYASVYCCVISHNIPLESDYQANQQGIVKTSSVGKEGEKNISFYLR
jgi:hypothetical protein